MLDSNDADSTAAYHVKVDPSGRVLVPAPVRARHQIHAGDTLIVRCTDSGLELRTYEQVLRDAQDYFCSLVPVDRILSEELIAERRREAASE